MNNTRIARCFAAVAATTLLVLGTTTAPAQARDTGWNGTGAVPAGVIG